VPARFIEHHVPTRHQEQAFIALEEKAARIRQQPLLFEGAEACRGENKGFDHFSFPSFLVARRFA
jgi:hypothetical protein